MAKIYNVLLVEDSPGDVMLVREAMANLDMKTDLHVVEDGAAALRFLRREEEYESARTPDLILLDLNLPIVDGREVLKEIKSDDALKMIPVAILSTSDSEDDVVSSYALSANCYIVKPMDMESFRSVVAAIDAFWLSVVELPPRD